MKNMKMRSKLIVLAVSIGLIPIILIGGISFAIGQNELIVAVSKSNNTFAELTKEQMNAYFYERTGDGNVIVNSKGIQDSLEIINNTTSIADEKASAYEVMDEQL